MPLPTKAEIVDDAVATVRSFPGLIAGFRKIAPTLADQLTSKPLIYSRSPWGTLAAGIVGWAPTPYGLGLHDDTAAIVAGACVLAGSYAIRLITR